MAICPVNATYPGTIRISARYGRKSWHSPGAYGGYQSAELDARLTATRTTTDTQARLQAVQAVQAYLLENAVVVPVYTPGWLWVYASSANLDGLTIAPFNRPQFNDVQLTVTSSVEADHLP